MRRFLVRLTTVVAGSAALLVGVVPSSPAATKTVTTSLADKDCTVIAEGRDEDWADLLCPGTAGYRLELNYGDAREDLTLRTPSRTSQKLDFFGRVGTGFSSIGPTAEWLVVDGRPTALTVRFRVVTSMDESTGDPISTSYLVVVKIAKKSCVVAAVPPSAGQNNEARRIAANAGNRPCSASKNS
jgi:hypothetical protein